MTPQEVADTLKISPAWVYKAAKDGRIPCIRICAPDNGKRKKNILRFVQSDIEAFIKRHYTGS